MLEIKEVFEWLNYNDRSHLSNDDQFSIRQLYDSKIPQSQKDGALKILKEGAVISSDDLERSEINASLGKYYYHIQNYESSIVYFNESEILQKKGTHRNAVIKWLRGIVYLSRQINIRAYKDWKETIEDFEKIRDFHRSSKSASLVNWYDDKIDKMRLDCTQTAEEAYTWLNKWGVSTLGDLTRSFVTEIEDRIKKNEFPSAYEIGIGLSRISRLRLNPHESAETSVVLAMNFYRMGQAKLAIDHFQKAGASFPPGQYQQAVTKWLLGVAQWELNSERDNAFRSWREAIELFHEAMVQTDHTNDQKKRLWLENQIKLMEKSLDVKTKERLWNS